MTRKATHDQIRTRVSAQYSETRVEYDNRKITPTNEEVWVRLTILPGEAQRASLGNTGYLEREPGVVVGQVIGPAYKGDGRLLEVADVLLGVLRQQISVSDLTITFKSPSVARHGLVDEGTRYQINLRVPFEADHVVGG